MVVGWLLVVGFCCLIVELVNWVLTIHYSLLTIYYWLLFIG
ncbi:MAG: hypothetical protein TRG1_2803 [Flavobacteriaceae bacterium FS1-H7996/R]|nr:MAG: hypothetical protein TRG1_2803 [Flavobacteriaceae bacterium FS1-H7996/R]